EPSGSTFLNLLDVYNMQNVEVIKGPSGSIYGAGNGGVLLINSTTPIATDQLSGSLTTGSFETVGYNLGYQNMFNNGSFSFKYANQSTDGYRDQSFLDRQTFEITGNTEYSKGRTVGVNLLYSELNYGIPGGLNAELFAQDPTQARPGSAETNASILHESMLFGVTHEMKFNQGLSNKSTLFGTFSDFENPFNFDYKVDSRMSGGFRSVSNYSVSHRRLNVELNAGIEYQASSYASRNYGNNEGSIGDLNFDDELKVQTATIFFTSNIYLTNDWFLNAGVSFNDVDYEINRLFSADSAEYGLPGNVSKSFNPQIIPRFGIAKRVTPQITAHASIGLGFSPPTIEEIRTNEGSINLDLEAEEGFNIEYGLRGNAFNARLMFDLVFFNYRLDESIVQQDTERGTAVFVNAGSTNQNGIELNSSFIVFDSFTSALRSARINLAYTYHSFTFDEYLTRDGDFSGNDLTGVAPNNLVTSLLVETRPGFYTNLSYNFTDQIPLEDDNSVYSEAYHLVQTKVGYKALFFKNLQADVYFGIDNLLDETYSLGFDINAFGGRYFQPAPERNWFAGVKLNYSL
ncbi:MAG: hypothetical protein MI700_07465, partial [Balneolales bacterium]|nr:hypothetical protein [Balneolales bacterium]